MIVIGNFYEFCEKWAEYRNRTDLLESIVEIPDWANIKKIFGIFKVINAQ